jgi:peroxiredoxin
MSMRVPFGKVLIVAVCACILSGGAGNSRAQDKDRAMPHPTAGAPAGDGMKMLEAGAVAPEFSIKDTAGTTFNLSEQRGRKPVLLVFWSMFCEKCRFEMPIVQKIHARYKDAGLEVVAVTVDGEPLKKSIVGFAKQEGYTFRILIDELDSRESFKAADPFGVAGTPTLYLIDRTGKIVLARAGHVREEDLEKAVQAVLKR